MALDPYASCPCGSGKKFKWCCQPLYAGINHAFDQDANGQHEAALRIMDDVVRQNAGNPEAWGQKAKLLYINGKVEDAEAALQKAFEINPNYPFGLLLRAVFRFQEGEFRGALTLARRAIEAYDPEAHDYLAQAYSIVFECEMKQNRPIAARAALQLVARYQPADENARETFDALFVKEGRLPACARREYTLLGPPAGAGNRAAWDRALQQATTPRLSELAHVFDALTQENPADAPAWYDLGLARAWLGDNAAALEALNRYLDMEADDGKATVAAALVEVLRCGQGMEEECDYHEFGFLHQFRDPQPVQALLDDWVQARRLVPLQAPQEGTLTALLLELTTASLITVGGPAADTGRLAGYLVIVGNVLQFSSPLQEAFERVRDEVRQRLALGLTELKEMRRPIQFHDVVAEALLFPLGKVESGAERVLAHAQTFYEDVWINRPRRSLAGNTPVDAAAHGTLRKKLRGVIQFIQDCAKSGMIAAYDFDRLRRKLGLLEGPAPAAAATGGTTSAATLDIGGMSTAELAGLKPEGLSDEQLEQAYQAAQKLDAGELAAHFAQSLVTRPPRSEHPDRYPWYSFLAQHALKEGNADAALDYVNEGEKADCEQNEGRRRNDYELRRGQIHVKRGEMDAAQDVFQRLIDRAPSNLRYRGSAAEAMLSAKQGARALRFAEEGLTEARHQDDRDSEQYLMELAEAARKQMG